MIRNQTLALYIQGSAMLLMERRPGMSYTHAVALVKWYIRFFRRRGYRLSDIMDIIDSRCLIDNREHQAASAIAGTVLVSHYTGQEQVAMLAEDCRHLLANLDDTYIAMIVRGKTSRSLVRRLQYLQAKLGHQLNWLGWTKTPYVMESIRQYIAGELS